MLYLAGQVYIGKLWNSKSRRHRRIRHFLSSGVSSPVPVIYLLGRLSLYKQHPSGLHQRRLVDRIFSRESFTSYFWYLFFFPGIFFMQLGTESSYNIGL